MARSVASTGQSFGHGDHFSSHYPTGVAGVDSTFVTDVKNILLVPHFKATGAHSSGIAVLLSFLPLLLFVGFFNELDVSLHVCRSPVAAGR
jgi:cell division protease FtsH